jgi:hypothetical protein
MKVASMYPTYLYPYGAANTPMPKKDLIMFTVVIVKDVFGY